MQGVDSKGLLAKFDGLAAQHEATAPERFNDDAEYKTNINAVRPTRPAAAAPAAAWTALPAGRRCLPLLLAEPPPGRAGLGPSLVPAHWYCSTLGSSGGTDSGRRSGERRRILYP